MRKNDTRLFSWIDVPLALVLLTRLPLPRLPAPSFARQARAVWAFPIAGLVVAGLAGLIGWGLLAIGLPPATAAGAILGCQILLTGAMHEDGLADTADGFWGGFDRDRRLAIMKDSQIGSYGVLALIVSLGLRWTALAALIPLGAAAPLLVTATLSRAAMPVLMAGLPNARTNGLSKSVGTPAAQPVLIGGLIAAIASLILMEPAATATLILVAACALGGMALLAHRKIGGQTGDVLGATQQVLEIMLLLTSVVLLAP